MVGAKDKFATGTCGSVETLSTPDALGSAAASGEWRAATGAATGKEPQATNVIVIDTPPLMIVHQAAGVGGADLVCRFVSARLGWPVLVCLR